MSGNKSREVVSCVLLLATSIGLTHCRFGYETRSSNAGGGNAGGEFADAASGGNLASNGSNGTAFSGGGADDVASSGGSQQASAAAGEGGAPEPMTAAGGPSSGGSDAGTAGTAGTAGSGTGGTGGMGGMGGMGNAGTGNAGAAGGGPVTRCQNTVDCTCAVLINTSYWFCENALDWAGAEAHCQTQSMHLVRIDSQLENSFVRTTANALAVFDADGFALTGANDRAVAGEWRWTDGTLFWQGDATGSAAGSQFTKWALSNPATDATQQCAGLLNTGDWQTHSCTALVPFICESP